MYGILKQRKMQETHLCSNELIIANILMMALVYLGNLVFSLKKIHFFNKMNSYPIECFFKLPVLS